jgi:hypothetical protein
VSSHSTKPLSPSLPPRISYDEQPLNTSCSGQRNVAAGTHLDPPFRSYRPTEPPPGVLRCGSARGLRPPWQPVLLCTNHSTSLWTLHAMFSSPSSHPAVTVELNLIPCTCSPSPPSPGLHLVSFRVPATDVPFQPILPELSPATTRPSQPLRRRDPYSSQPHPSYVQYQLFCGGQNERSSTSIEQPQLPPIV